MKYCILTLSALVAATAAQGGPPNVPSGVTGLWRFQDSANKLSATLGSPLVSSHVDNSGWMPGPITVIEPGLTDSGVVQERAGDYLTVNPNFTANGGGEGIYVNEYTIAIDYVQTSGLTDWNSLFQTANVGTKNDGDLWTDGTGRIGVGDTGYSALTYDVSTWHRIVWSVDNGSFFRVYVDGTLYLDAAGQAVDGRFALYTDTFHLFADDSGGGEDQWGLVGTVATWNRALTTDEVAGMGGWENGSPTPTPLTIPEPGVLSLLGLGSLALLFRRRK
jgi:hypothetical protein